MAKADSHQSVTPEEWVGSDPRSVHVGFVVERVALCLWQRQYVVNFEECNLVQVFKQCDWNFICLLCRVVRSQEQNPWMLGIPSVGPILCVLVDFGDAQCLSYHLHTHGCWGCPVLVLPSAYKCPKVKKTQHTLHYSAIRFVLDCCFRNVTFSLICPY
jgi:hypothetical protein